MSINIYIEHNPFIIETKFLIDGVEPDEKVFEYYKNSRMQLWIEGLFKNLKNEFNSVQDFDITFKGVEADWLDFEAAAQRANTEGMNVSVKRIPVTESTERLSNIQKLMQKAAEHPIFGEQIKNNKKIQDDFAAANNRDFDVYVAATMSAGKSTFINAMLGCDLLPAANEATTATIATITDNDNCKVGEFTGSRINKQDQVMDDKQSVNLKIL